MRTLRAPAIPFEGIFFTEDPASSRRGFIPSVRFPVFMMTCLTILCARAGVECCFGVNWCSISILSLPGPGFKDSTPW